MRFVVFNGFCERSILFFPPEIDTLTSGRFSAFIVFFHKDFYSATGDVCLRLSKFTSNMPSDMALL